MRALLNSFLQLFVSILFFAVPAHAAKTICSMTLNSADEAEMFRQRLEPQGFKFVELVPKSKNPNWFKDACASGIRCDALIISGHYGGLFFGEKSSSTISMAEMESASCSNSCPGILDAPREVFLMGCNTLATQKRDHRTFEQYLNVLVGDGIPLDFAEQVVSSRYSQQGFSLEKRFAAIFPKVSRLYGFSSTGPLGPAAATRLGKYLTATPDYDRHLTTLPTSKAANTALVRAFAGTSFQETLPTTALAKESRDLFCAIRGDEKQKTESVREIVQSNRLVGFFDSLASQIGTDSDTIASFRGLFDSATASSLRVSLDKIAKQQPGFATIQYQVLKVSYGLGLVTQDFYISRVNSLLIDSLKQELTYQKVSQLCEIAKQEPYAISPGTKALYQLSRQSPYFMLMLGCFHTLGSELRDFLKDKIVNPTRAEERTIALTIMKERWTREDQPWLAEMLKLGDQDLNRRLYLSAREILQGVRNGILRASDPFEACVLESENLGGKDLGTNWRCLTENNSALTADVCNHFASLNPDAENSDDMRWYCWSKRPGHFTRYRPECFLLGDTMGILGNRMKQVWNCTPR